MLKNSVKREVTRNIRSGAKRSLRSLLRKHKLAAACLAVIALLLFFSDEIPVLQDLSSYIETMADSETDVVYDGNSDTAVTPSATDTQPYTVYDITANAPADTELPAETPTASMPAASMPTASMPAADSASVLSSLSAAGYTGEPYCVVNENQPFFEQLSAAPLEEYSVLDALGRCGPAVACVGEDTLPTEERGQIGQVKPSGWHTIKYNGVVDGNYLYNRCHLIAFCLAGENANERNLVTGTRYMNTEGMLPFEMQVLDYVESTGNHVLYRATPVFHADNLICDGVLLEAASIEDTEIRFCVFCYNVQPGIMIDYATGDSSLQQ